MFRAYCTTEHHVTAAKELDISVQTLKNHLGSIYKKTGRHKAHSALYALCLSKGFDPLADDEKQPIG